MTVASATVSEAPLLQAVILRADLRVGRVPPLVFAARATLAFVVARACERAPPSLTTAEVAWLRGTQARVHLRAGDESELSRVVERARATGLPVHLFVGNRRVQRVPQRVTVCCAVGPADARQVTAITEHLARW